MANQPTNSEILKEIKSIHSVLNDHEQRLKPLEQWKIAFDAADAAIAKYKQEHSGMSAAADAAGRGVLGEGVNKDFLQIIMKILSLVGLMLGIIYAIVQVLQ